MSGPFDDLKHCFGIKFKTEVLDDTDPELNGARGAQFHVSLPSGECTTEKASFESTWAEKFKKDHSAPELQPDAWKLSPGTGLDLKDFEEWTESNFLTAQGELKKQLYLPWNGLHGNVVSGMDYQLLRTDGVLELSGRFTIRTDDRVLIDGAYEGLLNLEGDQPKNQADVQTNVQSGDTRLSPAYTAFLQGTLEPPTKVTLAFTFRTDTGPWSSAAGEDASWLTPQQKRHRLIAFRYAPLVRRSFVGLGTVKWGAGAKAVKMNQLAVELYGLWGGAS
jgi:Protein of unknown function (DUF3237)